MNVAGVHVPACMPLFISKQICYSYSDCFRVELITVVPIVLILKAGQFLMKTVKEHFANFQPQ